MVTGATVGFSFVFGCGTDRVNDPRPEKGVSRTGMIDKRGKKVAGRVCQGRRRDSLVLGSSGANRRRNPLEITCLGAEEPGKKQEKAFMRALNRSRAKAPTAR